MKPLNRKNYGSIPHLSNSKLGLHDHYIDKGQEYIITTKKRDHNDIIYSFEKYDGSNVGVCKVNNKIFALTKKGYIAKLSPFKQHHIFNDYVVKHESLFNDMLNNNERIVGEWLLQVHGLRYNIKSEPLIFFDYFNDNNERLIYSDLMQKINHYELIPPRLLNVGDSKKIDELLPILNMKTKIIESEELPEGIVFKVERNNKVDFLAKWIRPDFIPGKYCINVNVDDLKWNIKNYG